MKSISMIFQGLILLAILILILWRNPVLFSAKLLFDSQGRAAHQFFPVVHQSESPQLQSDPVSVYRNDEARTGFQKDADFQSVNLKKNWSIKGFNLGIHGASKASAAADESGIYIGSDAGVFSHYSWSGELRWTWWVTDHVRGIHSTAALSQHAVYFGAYNGQLYKLDKKTGQPIWTIDLGDAIGASPLLAGGALYVAVETSHPRDGYVVKLDPLLGQVIWKSPHLGEQSHSSPALSLKDGKLYLGANNAKLFAIDALSGEIVWSRQVQGEVKSTPVLVGDNLCYTDWGSEFVCVDTASGNVRFRHQLEGPSQVSPSYSALHHRLYVGDSKGFMFAFNSESKKMLWKRRVAGDLLMASPLLFQIKGRLHLLSACDKQSWCLWDAETMRLIFQAEGGGRLSGVPVIYKNKLVFSFDFPGELQVWSF